MLVKTFTYNSQAWTLGTLLTDTDTDEPMLEESLALSTEESMHSHLAICTSERCAGKTGAMHMDVDGSHSCHYLKSEINKLVRTAVTITQRNIIAMTE